MKLSKLRWIKLQLFRQKRALLLGVAALISTFLCYPTITQFVLYGEQPHSPERFLIYAIFTLVLVVFIWLLVIEN